jgi:IS66 C-terminal element
MQEQYRILHGYILTPNFREIHSAQRLIVSERRKLGLVFLPNLKADVADGGSRRDRRHTHNVRSFARSVFGPNYAERSGLHVALLPAENDYTRHSSTLGINLQDEGVDPQAWLADVLARLPDHPANKVADLLPRSWKANQQSKAAVAA